MILFSKQLTISVFATGSMVSKPAPLHSLEPFRNAEPLLHPFLTRSQVDLSGMTQFSLSQFEKAQVTGPEDNVVLHKPRVHQTPGHT
jgi:hypothetical protein